MFKHLSLKRLKITIIIIMVLFSGLFIANSLSLINQIHAINAAWTQYKYQHSVKPHLMNSLLASLGYGGMIHRFKDYELLKDDAQYAASQLSMGATRAILRQYRGLNNSTEESRALTEIKDTMDEYEISIDNARFDIKNGRSSRDIDKLTRVDDRYAMHGLEVLKKSIIQKYPVYGTQNKTRLAYDLRASMGYGGMVHGFKNYILRGNKVYRKTVEDAISHARTLIVSYRAMQPTRDEKIALDAISNVLDAYHDRINIVDRSIAKGLSPEQIAVLVKVDDSQALIGLDILDHENILRVDRESRRAEERLQHISRQYSYYTYGVFAATLLFVILLFILFNRKVIHPVRELSRAMTELTRGNTRAVFNYPETAKTELGEMARALRVFQDNEQKRREVEAENRRLAMTDPLTGLANRNQLEKRYAFMAALARREKRMLAILAMDLDKFKPVNDNLGHAAGDTVLRTVAERLNIVFRETDTVARVGGDEFTVVFYGPEDSEAVRSVATRVLQVMSTPFPVDEVNVSIGVSIGIVIHKPDSEDTLDILMKQADIALYEAKSSGRNTFHIYNKQTDNLVSFRRK